MKILMKMELKEKSILMVMNELYIYLIKFIFTLSFVNLLNLIKIFIFKKYKN